MSLFINILLPLKAVLQLGAEGYYFAFSWLVEKLDNLFLFEYLFIKWISSSVCIRYYCKNRDKKTERKKIHNV